MRSAFAFLARCSMTAASLLVASCVEPDRSNGEPCLRDYQCESDFCRAGLCTTRPSGNERSDLPLADASVDANDAAADSPVESATDAEDASDGADSPDVAKDGPADVVKDGPADVANDAPPDVANDAPPDVAVQEASPDAPQDADDEAANHA